MAGPTLAALVVPTPSVPAWARDWVDGTLRPRLDEAGPLTHWSVGAVLGNETLVQSRPKVRPGDDPIEDLLRTDSGCTLGVFADGSPDVHGIARFRRWIGVEPEIELTAEERSALRAELPPFLSRGPNHRSDAEIVFLRFLASLHEEGAFGKRFATPQEIRRGLSALGERMKGSERLNLFVTDGRTLGILHRGGMLIGFDTPRDAKPAVLWTVDRSAPSAAPANLLVWDPGPAPLQPIPGAERIAPGVITIETARPRVIRRD